MLLGREREARDVGEDRGSVEVAAKESARSGRMWKRVGEGEVEVVRRERAYCSSRPSRRGRRAGQVRTRVGVESVLSER